MPARLDPLDDERVRPRRGRLHSLLRIGDGHPHRRPNLLQPLHHRGGGAAEGERHHRHPLLHQQLHLLLVVVLVEPGVAQHHPKSRRLVTKAVGVTVHGVAVSWTARGGEHVHTERLLGQLTSGGDVGEHRFRSLVAGSQEPQPAGTGHGSS